MGGIRPNKEVLMGGEAARSRRGRPRHGPIVLQPPEILPMTPKQNDAAIRALVALLDSWLAAKRRFGSEGDVGGRSVEG
jgi:hypothetical protein